jgi:hypothetical protein
MADGSGMKLCGDAFFMVCAGVKGILLVRLQICFQVCFRGL